MSAGNAALRLRGAPGDVSVRFVVVPFLPTLRPALGVSSLLSVLRRDGIDADTCYLNLAYGEHIGWELYSGLVDNMTSSLPGEMIFTKALWADRAPSVEDYDARLQARLSDPSRCVSPTVQAYRLRSKAWWDEQAEAFRKAVAEAPAVVAAWADEVLAGGPRVLGFTTTFQQSIAALALAQEVRRRVPAEEVAILFGGANCEGDMGRAMAENFGFIDCVVSGEAEDVIVDLVRKATGDGNGEPLPRFVQGEMVRDMDSLPLPIFDDYFTALGRISLREEPHLAVESSRGCWWGVKSHCTFCGLNGGTMAFRSKSAPRFATELETLSRKYGTRMFAVTDNILDMSYLRSLFPDLIRQGRSYRLFYETKSNLRKSQVEMLAAAGIFAIQPGIESFSSSILKLMGKGTTRLQNIQTLKWCTEMGLGVLWNLLFGFPGEDPSEYQSMAGLLPSLVHFPAPMGVSPVRVDRFGRYWSSPERFGIRGMRRYWSYDFAYAGVPAAERERLAYFFEHETEGEQSAWQTALPVIEAVSAWKEATEAGASLVLRESAAGPVVRDTRPCRIDESLALSEAGLALLRTLDSFRRRDGIADAVREQGVDVSDAECERLLADMAARRFVVEDEGLLLSVVVDPSQRERVAELQVALRVERLGLRWPDDFPDPEKARVVRAAMLALGQPAPAPGA